MYNKVKYIWIIIFSTLILMSVLYVPYNIKTSYSEKFMGYGFIFKQSVTSRFTSDDPKKIIDEIRLQEKMTIDYKRIIIEIIGAGATCSIGYIISTMFKKQK